MGRQIPLDRTSEGKPLSFQTRVWLKPMGLALLAGLLMSLAPAPLNLWPIAWIALAPLWVLAVQGRWKVAALWGFAYHGISLFWITGLHPLTWLGLSWGTSVAIVTVIWLFITGWGVATVLVWAGAMAWMGRQQFPTGLRVLAGTALWCALETLRNHSPLDWTTLAYTQSPGNPVILHLGQLAGPMAVTAAIVAVNGLLAEAWLAGNSKPWISWLLAWNSRSQTKTKFLRAIGLLLISHAIGLGLSFQPLEASPNTALSVGIVQGNVPTRIKLSPQGIQQGLHNYSLGYRILADQGANLIITSEAAMPFEWQDRSPSVLDQVLSDRQVPLVLGSFGQRGDRTTQAMLMLNPQGQIQSQYDKVKVVPLGESLPFEEILGKFIGRLSPIRSYLLAGAAHQRFVTPFGNAAIGICYESAFPELFRDQVQGGAQFLITASNLDPYSSVLMAQHQAHDLMRAIETDRWIVRATNTGYSGVINPHGRILWRSADHEFTVHRATIHRRQTQTLYTRWGNWLTPVLLILSSIWILQQLKFSPMPFKSSSHSSN
ncbi:apolipoprotein N-acyltransferase [Alkalinema pantanalense CENA528]|uniref:apolipoprotein N-acyltransferase n=1 Tax=Alkalinema pantanalense TaxID=1620705 RepID=UPI003D6DBB6B